MKTLLISLTVVLVAFFGASHVEASENDYGTLTLKSDKIIFQTKSKAFVYSIGKVGTEIPGIKIVKFEPKSLDRDGKEIDVSEITLENQSNGDKFLLTEAKPVNFIRSSHGNLTTWTLETK